MDILTKSSAVLVKNMGNLVKSAAILTKNTASLVKSEGNLVKSAAILTKSKGILIKNTASLVKSEGILIKSKGTPTLSPIILLILLILSKPFPVSSCKILQIDSLRSPFGLPAAVFLRFAPILSNLLQIRLPPIILSFMILSTPLSPLL